MSSDLLPIDLPRLPLLSLASQRSDGRPSPPDVRASGHPILTTSGRAAIALGLEALGIGCGDRVLVPTYHCPTMVAPVARVGAEPVFFPLNDSGEPDLQWLREHGRDAKAILVAHYFGVPIDLAKVRAFCDEHGLALVEDCAHAFFGFAGDRVVGGWGDVVTASLTKFFPSPDGGLLIFRSPGLREVELQRAPLAYEIRAWLDMFEMSARYKRLGFFNAVFRGLFGLKALLRKAPSSRLEEPVVALPTVSSCLDETLIYRRASAAARWVTETSLNARIMDVRRDNYRLLVDLLGGVSGVRPLIPQLPPGAAPYVCPIALRSPDHAYTRLRMSGVPVFRWDVLWPGTPSLHRDAGGAWSRSVLQVACHQDLSNDDVRVLARMIAEVVEAATEEIADDAWMREGEERTIG